MGFSKLHTKEVLRTNLCDSKDAFILVRGKITIIGHNLTQVAFKYCAPFIQCITKIDETTINDAEDLCLVMLVYNLLECSSNYFDRAGSLQSYYKDEANNFNANIVNGNAFKFFQYKAKLLGKTVADGANGIFQKITIVAPLKYLSIAWKSFEMLLINWTET